MFFLFSQLFFLFFLYFSRNSVNYTYREVYLELLARILILFYRRSLLGSDAVCLDSHDYCPSVAATNLNGFLLLLVIMLSSLLTYFSLSCAILFFKYLAWKKHALRWPNFLLSRIFIFAKSVESQGEYIIHWNVWFSFLKKRLISSQKHCIVRWEDNARRMLGFTEQQNKEERTLGLAGYFVRPVVLDMKKSILPPKMASSHLHAGNDPSGDGNIRQQLCRVNEESRIKQFRPIRLGNDVPSLAGKAP